MRIAIVQRVVKGYRLPVYRELSRDHDVRFIYGDDLEGTKSKSCDVTDVNCVKCRTRHFWLGSKALTFHRDLIARLRDYEPDIILVEGESHVIGYLQAFLYRSFYNSRAGVMKWCFIELPGEERRGLRFLMKLILQRGFDAFILYSSFSKKALERYRIDTRRGFVTVNVADVETLLQVYEERYLEKSDARKKLNVSDRFSVLFIGNFERQKKFERYLDVADLCRDLPVQFLVAGGGINFEHYMHVAKERGLENVKFLGHLSDPSKAYFASDVVYIPGRGGMVISEALCFARPVIVHYADGTEFDLIDGQDTGYILEDDSETVVTYLVSMVNSPGHVEEMGGRGQELVRCQYNTRNMANKIVEAAEFSIESRL